MKKYKALPSITQDEESFDRFGAIDPRWSGMVKKFPTTYPKTRRSETEFYYQLQVNIDLCCALIHIAIKNCIIIFFYTVKGTLSQQYTPKTYHITSSNFRTCWERSSALWMESRELYSRWLTLMYLRPTSPGWA